MLETFYILVRAWQQEETGLVSAEDVLTKKDYEKISKVIKHQAKKQITIQGFMLHYGPSAPINNGMIQKQYGTLKRQGE